jgi:hypothetical protein
MKRLCASGVLIIAVSCITLTHGEDKNNSYFQLKSSFPSDAPFEYQSLLLSYTLHWAVRDRLTLHLSLQKGSGENGYYPSGYFSEPDGGVYEKGSCSITYRGVKELKTLIVGNYTPLFGQGLLFGRSFPLILSTPYYDVARYRDALSPASSPSKSGLLEGAAAELAIGGLRIRPFVSWNEFDCSAGESDYYLYNDNDSDGIPNDVDDDDFSGIRDGFPRSYSCKTDLLRSIREEPQYDTDSARAKRNNLREYVAGVNLSGGTPDLKIGGTVAYTRFNRLVDPPYDFDAGDGGKTGNAFRGKDFLASSLSFKSYGSFEIFGETVFSLYRRLSYYPEFNGDYSSALGFSGGVRTKDSKTGYVVWGAYLPANLVNPHGQELPGGVNNLACALFGLHWGGNRDAWVYFHRELHNAADPFNPESGLSLTYDLEYPLRREAIVDIKQELELLDNYYYAPGEGAWKLASRLSIKREISGPLSVKVAAENRLGGPFSDKAGGGVGVSAELLRQTARSSGDFFLMGYTAARDGFSSLYPYERSLYTWSFFPRALRGNGLFSYLAMVATLPNDVTVGGKIRYILDFGEPSGSEASFYLISEIGF